MSWGQVLPLGLAVTVFSAAVAGAQVLPWPSEPGQAGAPAPVMGAPSMAAPTQMLPHPQPGPPPCIVEFTRLRGEVEKRNVAAKAAGERKAPREEMCKLVVNMVAAESKWVKYTIDNASSCGIPPKIVTELKAGHDHMLTVRKRICDAGAAAAAQAAPPSLSDALGTTRLPLPDNTTTKRGGTLDTLTGNPIR